MNERDAKLRRRLAETVYEKPRIVDVISVSVGRPSWLTNGKGEMVLVEARALVSNGPLDVAIEHDRWRS